MEAYFSEGVDESPLHHGSCVHIPACWQDAVSSPDLLADTRRGAANTRQRGDQGYKLQFGVVDTQGHWVSLLPSATD